MEDDMVVRGFASRTRSSYLWGVTSLARFYHRSPDQISDAEVQAYLVHLLRERQLSCGQSCPKASETQGVTPPGRTRLTGLAAGRLADLRPVAANAGTERGRKACQPP